MYPHPLLPGKGVLRCSKELPLAIKEACRLRQKHHRCLLSPVTPRMLLWQTCVRLLA